jgi:cytochrome c553
LPVKRFLLSAVGLGVAGILVIASGVVPVKASSGHWRVTEWLLHFTMRRSVATHSTTTASSLREDPALVLKGAGHYETGCRPCHGSPDLPLPRIPRAMTPNPPPFPSQLGPWDADELFYIVKHGVKFTGMPAWPSQTRDDEVRAMVAFLRVLPTLDAAAYRELVDGDVVIVEAVEPLADLVAPDQLPASKTAGLAKTCARCHGVDGLGRGVAAFPKLAGQRAAYLFAALGAYARDERQSGIMQPIAAALREDEMRALADYYARLPAGPPESSASAAAVERGRAIAMHGVPGQGVPACRQCHGPLGAAAELRRNPAYPRLEGQFADYLELQLQLFHAGHRGGSPWARLMDHVAPHLRPEQMRDVARYYASQPLLPRPELDAAER